MMETNLTVNQIERSILNMHGGMLKVLAVPNVCWGMCLGYEADLIVVSRKGYATEYEIKRSWRDFKKDMKKRKRTHYAECIYNFAYVVPEKIKDKVKAHFDKTCTEYDMPCAYAYRENGFIYKVCGKLHPRKRLVMGCRAMTKDEQFQLARLGVIRYWNSRTQVDNIQHKKGE